MTVLPPLTTETVQGILDEKFDDDMVHQLVWYHLGYRQDPETAIWNSDLVSEKWREKFPEPPLFIESRPATVQLTRSIPKPNKQFLKTKLKFKGYTIDQLVPRLTRRATIASWLLSHMAEQGLLEL